MHRIRMTEAETAAWQAADMAVFGEILRLAQSRADYSGKPVEIHTCHGVRINFTVPRY